VSDRSVFETGNDGDTRDPGDTDTTELASTLETGEPDDADLGDHTCPGCGIVVTLEPGRRDAAAFCPSCDYPLFWAGGRATVLDTNADAEASLRRLPGTAGMVTVGMITCWQCREPNPVTNTFCLRCGADLSGPPVVVEPEPEPVPPPPPPPPPPPEPVLWPLLVMLIIVAVFAVYGLWIWD
jgi:hypothetical protein